MYANSGIKKVEKAFVINCDGTKNTCVFLVCDEKYREQKEFVTRLL